MSSQAPLSLTVSAGGCSGYTSEFTVEPAPRDGDARIDVNGLALFVPQTSCALLEGVTIDFADTPTQTGLIFRNPKAQACGCTGSAPAGQPPGVARIDVASIRLGAPKAAPR